MTALDAARASRIDRSTHVSGYDAVHLACALQVQGDDILLATWDNALNAAARATGQLLTNDTV
jgi:predicted nucleic acid-binding protein